MIKLKIIGGYFLWKEKEEKVLMLLREKERIFKIKYFRAVTFL